MRLEARIDLQRRAERAGLSLNVGANVGRFASKTLDANQLSENAGLSMTSHRDR
jgi:hypothetical protein